MKRLALLSICTVATCLFVAMDKPPVEQLVEGQTRCGSSVCLGTKDTPLKSSNEFVATGSTTDGGLVPPHFEYGTTTAASGRAAVTFKHTFSVLPQCQCTAEADSGCVLEGPATTTTAVFHGATSSVIEYFCVGAR